MSYVSQGVGGTDPSSGPVVKQLLRRYSRHARPASAASTAPAAVATLLAPTVAPTGPVADVAADASAAKKGGIFGQPEGIFGPQLGAALAGPRGGLFGQSKGIFGPQLGSAAPGRSRRRKLLPASGVRFIVPPKPLKVGEVRPLNMIRAYFPWIASGEMVDDGADRFAVRARGTNFVRINFYDPGGILVDQQDFYQPPGLSGLLVPNFMARFGPTMLRDAPATDVTETQLDAMETGTPTEPGTAGMGCYRVSLSGTLVPNFMSRFGPQRAAAGDASDQQLDAMEAGEPTDPGTSGMGSYRLNGLGIATSVTPVPKAPLSPDIAATYQPADMTFTAEEAGNNMVSMSTRTIQTQLRKVGAGCIAEDGKWGPNTSGAFSRWATGAGQSGRAQRSASSSSAPATGASTVFIEANAKRQLASDSAGRTDQCGRETVRSETTVLEQLTPDAMLDEGGGVPKWVFGVSAGILALGVGAAVVSRRGKGTPAAPAATRAAPRKAAKKTTTRRTSRRKTSKRLR